MIELPWVVLIKDKTSNTFGLCKLTKIFYHKIVKVSQNMGWKVSKSVKMVLKMLRTVKIDRKISQAERRAVDPKRLNLQKVPFVFSERIFLMFSISSGFG